MESITTIHIAGIPDGYRQRCARCGEILIDYANTASIGEWQPSWWAPGGFVGIIAGNPTQSTALERDAQDLNEIACHLAEMVA